MIVSLSILYSKVNTISVNTSMLELKIIDFISIYFFFYFYFLFLFIFLFLDLELEVSVTSYMTVTTVTHQVTQVTYDIESSGIMILINLAYIR